MPTTQKLVRFTSDTDKALYEKALRSVDLAVRSYVWYLDPEGHIKHGNQQADSLASLERTRGMHFAEAIGLPASAEQWQPELQKIIKSGIGVFGARETVMVGGQPRQFSVDKIPTLDRWGGVNGLLLVVNDITEEAARENALLESEARYKAFIATTTDAVWCYEVSPPVDTRQPPDEQVAQIAERARLVECNQYYAELYGAENPDALLGAKMASTTISNFLGKLRLFIAAGYQLADKETARELEHGDLEYWQITAMGTVDDEGFLQRIWGTSKNITDRRRFLEKLHYQATHDALTELPNRTLLHQQIQQAIEEHNGNSQMALLIVDLDRFKEINDTLGHHAGDRLLRQLGPRLADEMQNLPGIIARLGGDEFAIFLSSVSGAEQASEVAQRILAAIRQPFVIEGFHTEISASIGIALCPDQATDVSTLMRYADVAMYRAKRDMVGVSVYQAEQDPHSPKRLALMGELGKAIRENQLLLHYQPKVVIGSNEVQGFEALLRWMHPTMGLVSPDDFIPIAESTGIIRPLTVWVLNEAIAQCKAWMDRGMEAAVAVNLSSRSLLDQEIVTTIAELLAAHRLPASMLELEITESAMMADPPRALLVLQAIHELGVRLSIDDFGTGYSSLSYLKKLPVQTLKIDYSFVVAMLEDEQDRIIVNSIVNLAHNLGLQVVAEGVENARTLAALQDMHCDIAQGYYLLHPQVASDAERWLRRREEEKELALSFEI
ncbi:EAL domain-containing protein [Proteobacteria bacterium 005FR1]|nr:EAL domain-containing protein [Proteobacteria bacterium 005FR1]